MCGCVRADVCVWMCACGCVRVRECGGVKDNHEGDKSSTCERLFRGRETWGLMSQGIKGYELLPRVIVYVTLMSDEASMFLFRSCGPCVST